MPEWKCEMMLKRGLSLFLLRVRVRKLMPMLKRERRRMLTVSVLIFGAGHGPRCWYSVLDNNWRNNWLGNWTGQWNIIFSLNKCCCRCSDTATHTDNNNSQLLRNAAALLCCSPLLLISSAALPYCCLSCVKTNRRSGMHAQTQLIEMI